MAGNAQQSVRQRFRLAEGGQMPAGNRLGLQAQAFGGDERVAQHLDEPSIRQRPSDGAAQPLRTRQPTSGRGPRHDDRECALQT